jgi:hypothetical protein
MSLVCIVCKLSIKQCSHPNVASPDPDQRSICYRATLQLLLHTVGGHLSPKPPFELLRGDYCCDYFETFLHVLSRIIESTLQACSRAIEIRDYCNLAVLAVTLLPCAGPAQLELTEHRAQDSRRRACRRACSFWQLSLGQDGTPGLLRTRRWGCGLARHITDPWLCTVPSATADERTL